MLTGQLIIPRWAEEFATSQGGRKMTVASVKAALGAIATAMLFAPSAYAGQAIYVDGTGNITPDEMRGFPPDVGVLRHGCGHREVASAFDGVP